MINESDSFVFNDEEQKVFDSVPNLHFARCFSKK